MRRFRYVDAVNGDQSVADPYFAGSVRGTIGYDLTVKTKKHTIITPIGGKTFG
jgi:hypothetical protein